MMFKLIDNQQETPTIEFRKVEWQTIELRPLTLDEEDQVEECKPEEATFYGVYIRFTEKAFTANDALKPSMHLRDFLSEKRAIDFQNEITARIKNSKGFVNEIAY